MEYHRGELIRLLVNMFGEPSRELIEELTTTELKSLYREARSVKKEST